MKTLTPISIKNLRARAKIYEVPDGGCRGLRVIVQVSGHKSFAVRYRFRGAPKKLTLGPVLLEDLAIRPDPGEAPVLDTPLTLADARWLGAQALRQVKSGIDPAVVKQAQRNQSNADGDSVQAIGDEYIRRHGHLRSLAQRRYDLGLVNAVLGAKPITSVKLSDIVRLQDKIEAEHGPAAADRVRATWQGLASWHAGRVDDFRPPILRGAKRSQAGARSRVLSDEEIRAVWAAAEAFEGPFGRYVQFLLLTCARRNEANFMRFEELADRATWVIPASRCKTKVDVLIPLSAAAQSIVHSMPHGNGDFVFSKDGGPYGDG